MPGKCQHCLDDLLSPAHSGATVLRSGFSISSLGLSALFTSSRSHLVTGDCAPHPCPPTPVFPLSSSFRLSSLWLSPPRPQFFAHRQNLISKYLHEDQSMHSFYFCEKVSPPSSCSAPFWPVVWESWSPAVIPGVHSPSPRVGYRSLRTFAFLKDCRFQPRRV